MRIFLVVFALFCGWLQASASEHQQHCVSSAPPFSNVANAVKGLMSQPKSLELNDSFSEKAIERSGDSAAVAIAKQVSDDELAEPFKMTRALYILRNAFEYPDMIEGCNDRTPEVTMLLLEHLDRLQNGTFHSEIQKTRTLIMNSVNASQKQ